MEKYIFAYIFCQNNLFKNNKINNIPVSKKILKKLHCGINKEAYHNRDLVKNTWCVFSTAKATALALKTAKFTENQEKRTLIDLNDVSDESDSKLSDDSDSSGYELKTTKLKKPIDKSEALSQIQKLLKLIPNTIFFKYIIIFIFLMEIIIWTITNCSYYFS